MFRSAATLLLTGLSLLMTACSTIPTQEARRAIADALAAARGWQSEILPADQFELAVFAPRQWQANELLTIYIEGDGLAWVTGTMPSADPTPRDPLALRLALAQPSGNAAYLGRPCQYVDAARSNCPQGYWTELRFAPETVVAMNSVVDILKARFAAKRLSLVGYSGGGNFAALLAARRTDVVRLITVAGNLDHHAWTTHHRVRPLSGSLNAADVSDRLVGLTQTHFIGGKDRVIPPALAQRWPAAFLGPQKGNLRIMPAYDHTCCWAEHWPALLN